MEGLLVIIFWEQHWEKYYRICSLWYVPVLSRLLFCEVGSLYVCLPR